MALIDRDAICDPLRELSDVESQRQLWLSDGSQGKDVSSFSEAVEQLFTDTGLSDILRSGPTGLGDSADAILKSLEVILLKVDTHHGPAQTIEDPSMEEVRAMASQLLSILSRSTPL